jgi:hypothetical protein
MPSINQNVLNLVDSGLINARASAIGNNVYKGTSKLQSLPYRLSYPLLGINPLSKKSVGDYLPTWLPVAAASGLAGGTFLASPALGGMAALGRNINPKFINPTIGNSIEITSLAKPGLSISAYPYSSIIEQFGGTLAPGSLLPLAGIMGLPIAAGALAKAGYKLYSKAGQAKSLELLRKQLQSNA